MISPKRGSSRPTPREWPGRDAARRAGAAGQHQLAAFIALVAAQFAFGRLVINQHAQPFDVRSLFRQDAPIPVRCDPRNPGAKIAERDRATFILIFSVTRMPWMTIVLSTALHMSCTSAQPRSRR
jgi:hypothetical protein